MTFCGGQRDAPRNTIPRTNFRRDAGPSTALAGYAATDGGRWRRLSSFRKNNYDPAGDASPRLSTVVEQSPSERDPA